MRSRESVAHVVEGVRNLIAPENPKKNNKFDKDKDNPLFDITVSTSGSCKWNKRSKNYDFLPERSQGTINYDKDSTEFQVN